MTTLYVLDDHDLIRRGVLTVLEWQEDITVVGEGASVREALEHIPMLRPDVALLDVVLPDGSGIEVCRAMSAASPDTRCLMLTSYSEDEALVEAMAAGAAGFVLKDTLGTALVEAIKTVAGGGSMVDSSLTSQVLQRMRQGPQPDPLEALSPQERRILAGIGEGLTNRQIGSQMNLAEQTIKNYVSKVLDKLGFENRSQAAAHAARLKGQGHEL